MIMTLKEVFEKCLEMQEGEKDERKAMAGALSLFTGGMFDAMEYEESEKAISHALKQVKGGK